jgi:hypothetical protein
MPADIAGKLLEEPMELALSVMLLARTYLHAT